MHGCVACGTYIGYRSTVVIIYTFDTCMDKFTHALLNLLLSTCRSRLDNPVGSVVPQLPKMIMSQGQDVSGHLWS